MDAAVVFLLEQPFLEKGNDFIACRQRRFPDFIDEMRRDNTVWMAHHLFGEWWKVLRVASAVGKHAANELVAEGVGVGSKPFSPTERITLKAIAEHGELIGLHTLGDRADLFR